ncbi:hypothetical protein AB0I54_44375 [Streptomyces sp. NPDC050625]|uniref:hypothetical protein n=1 Tax=Streptomyces sp. NPDC050625 TaxID=3154629 RepID=UPI00343B51EF
MACASAVPLEDARKRLRLLQEWAGRFRTYWGSDAASFGNYQSHLDADPTTDS